MKDSRYINLMEKVLSAYSDEHIARYYEQVKAGGLKEHGFPRLTADIGILISYGRRTDLKDRLVQMMDLCCDEIPRHKNCANEFSVKEIVFALLELGKHRVFSPRQIGVWKEKLKDITVGNCYRVYAVREDSDVNNWGAFTMVSEWMRYQINAAPEDRTFIDIQEASQWLKVDENGMYRDPHEPMVYDLVTRGLFSLLFFMGGRGKYFEQWDNALKKAGLFTLKMFSVCGEIPYGGRSNQFLHNEAHAAVILEYEALRYARLGDGKTASEFKAAAVRALDSLDRWLSEKPINHVKNFFPRETAYGCEDYAYFDKYMITAASFLYVAHLFASAAEIPAGETDDVTGETWRTSDHFHKLFLRAGEYFAEYDYNADYHYDASGLGRLHRKGAPPAICLSTPGTDHPDYGIHTGNAVPFAIAPEMRIRDEWLSGADRSAVHDIRCHQAQGAAASAEILCRLPENCEVKTSYVLSGEGLRITAEGGDVGLMLPAFQFDGREECAIENSGAVLTVGYRNWICRYRAENGVIRDTGKTGCNRNGHYKIFRAEGKGRLSVSIAIFPADRE